MNALAWAQSTQGTTPPPEVYCPTRDVADGRLPKLYQLAERSGLSEQRAALLAAVAGELTANCFDHNIGAWLDVPGCWFSFELKDNSIAIEIADRGQGFLSSLKRVKPSLATHQEAIITALTEEISGRAPERRGRGLKFIASSLNGRLPDSHWILQTGNARLAITAPVEPAAIPQKITENNSSILGTYAALSVPVAET